MCMIKDKQTKDGYKQKTDCYCNRIKEFILADNNKQFKAQFFQPFQITELYSFLRAAYKFNVNNPVFDAHLETLISTFVRDESRCEINVIEDTLKKNLVEAYDQYMDFIKKTPKASAEMIGVQKAGLCVHLDKLIHNAEIMSHNTIGGVAEVGARFQETLKANEPNEFAKKPRAEFGEKPAGSYLAKHFKITPKGKESVGESTSNSFYSPLTPSSSR